MKPNTLVRLRTVLTLATFAGLLFSSANSANGVTIIGADSASASYNVINGNPNLVINQSGLSQNYVSGVTNFDTFVGSATHGTVTTGNAVQLLENPFPGNESYAFGFASAKTIDAIAFWYSNLVTSANLEIYADIDNDFTNGTSGLLASFTVFSSVAPISSVVIPISTTTTSFIHLHVVSATNPAFAFGEIAFRSAIPIPEPATATLGLLSVAGLMMRRRRMA